MHVQLQNIGEKLLIAPQEDRLDATVAASFKGQVLDAINNGNLDLVLDLEKVGFIDSSGLSALISVLKNLGQSGRMVICGLNPTAMHLFRLTRLDHIIPVYPSQAAALAS